MSWPAGLSLAIGVLAWALVIHAAVNAALLRRPIRAPGLPVADPVSVLMPMRNEALRLHASLAAALTQQGLADFELLVLDDESTDGTPDLARSLVGSRPTVMSGTQVPDGWLGKTWACQQLSDAARGEVFVFVDADVVLSAEAVAAAVRLLRTTGLDFVSPYPRQLAGCSLGLLTQPLLAWSWLTFLPLRLTESSRRRSLAAANGQFLVVDSRAYRKIGGHVAVAGEVIDDVALARSLKATGCRGGFVDGSRIATCRMYDDNRDLVDGYAKSLWTAFGSTAGAALTAVMLLALFVLPWLLVTATPWAWFAAAAGPAGRVIAAARTRDNALLSLLHPLSMLCFVALVGVSLMRHRAGRTSWKGRSLP